ncbi:hypothetical protein UlMin_026722 [Ulmus minor]
MGFGKVGSEGARRAKGLGMHVISHDPYAPADIARAVGVELVLFDQAISTADFVSLHMPLTPSTFKLFNDNTFAKMKKGVRIVNVARGGVIVICFALYCDLHPFEPKFKDQKLDRIFNKVCNIYMLAPSTENHIQSLDFEKLCSCCFIISFFYLDLRILQICNELFCLMLIF